MKNWWRFSEIKKIQEIRSRIERFKAMPSKAGPGCAAGLILFIVFCLYIERIQAHAAESRNANLLPFVFVVISIGGFFVLYWICIFFVNMFGGIASDGPSRQFFNFDGKWFLRRKGVCLILSIGISLWLIAIPVCNYIKPKSDWSYGGHRLTADEARSFLIDVRSVMRQLKMSNSLGKHYTRPPLLTEAGQEVSRLVAARDKERVFLHQELSRVRKESMLLGDKALATDSSLEKSRKVFERIVAIETKQNRLADMTVSDLFSLARKMSDTPWLFLDPMPSPSPEPFLVAYRKLFKFIKGKERKYRGTKLVFMNSKCQKVYFSLLDQAVRAMLIFKADEMKAGERHFGLSFPSQEPESSL